MSRGNIKFDRRNIYTPGGSDIFPDDCEGPGGVGPSAKRPCLLIMADRATGINPAEGTVV